MASSPSKPSACGSGAPVDRSTVSDCPITLSTSNDPSEVLEIASESNNNRGLKRKAGDALMSNSDERCMFSELPEEVLCHIMSFQAHKDRFPLAAVCSYLRNGVEAFSKRKLEEIKAKADATWEERVHDYTFIETDRTEPVELPHRYLLSKSYQTYLYTLGDPGEQFFTKGVHVLPGGERLVTRVTDGSNWFCDTWDLPTRRCIKRFHIASGPAARVHGILQCGDKIVSAVDESVLVCNDDREIVHQVNAPHPPRTFKLHAVYRQKVLFTYVGDNNSISCLDLATGSIHSGVITWEERLSVRSFGLLVSGDMLLVHCQSDAEDRDNKSRNVDGIYVFDLQDYSQKHFFPGGYHSLAVASDEPIIIAAARNYCIDIFELRDEKVSRTKTFNRSEGNVLMASNDILLLTRSRVYVRGKWKVQVYSILNGELLHTFDLPASVTQASTNGRELFFGLGHSKYWKDRPCVQAHTFQEY